MATILSLIMVVVSLLGGPSDWDRSSLTFTGGCSGDCSAITATVCNTGSGDMAGETSYEVWYAASGNPKFGSVVGGGTVPALLSGQCATLSFTPSASGNYMFRALQRPGHPGQGDLWSGSCSVVCSAPSPTPSPTEEPTVTPTPDPTEEPTAEPSPDPGSGDPGPLPTPNPPVPSETPDPGSGGAPGPTPTTDPTDPVEDPSATPTPVPTTPVPAGDPGDPPAPSGGAGGAPEMAQSLAVAQPLPALLPVTGGPHTLPLVAVMLLLTGAAAVGAGRRLKRRR